MPRPDKIPRTPHQFRSRIEYGVTRFPQSLPALSTFQNKIVKCVGLTLLFLYHYLFKSCLLTKIPEVHKVRR